MLLEESVPLEDSSELAARGHRPTTAGAASVPAAACNLLVRELHYTTARKETEPYRAGGREDGRLGPYPASQLCDLRAGSSASQKGGRVLRPGKTYRALTARHCVSRATHEFLTQPKLVLSGCCCEVAGVWWRRLPGVGKR